MAKRIGKLGLSILTTLIITQSKAQTTNVNGTINTITTAVPFLRISPDARAGGMGDVGIATSADANSQYWNVAKLPFSAKKFGVSLTVTPWLKDIVPDVYMSYLSGYAKFGENDNQAISGSLRYFSLGDISYVDVNASPTGTGKPREFSFDAGYSRKLSPVFSTGLSLRYIHSAIAAGVSPDQANGYHPGNAFAADLALFYSKTKEKDEFRSNNFSAGLVISNLGSKIAYNAVKKDFIPMNLGLGFAYTSKFDEYNKITFGLDLNRLLVPTPLRLKNSVGDDSISNGNYVSYYPEKSVMSGLLGSFSDAPGGFSEELKEFTASLGAEYMYQNQFAIRAGYFYEDATKGNRKYLTCGLGVRWTTLSLNLSYLVPSGGTSRNPLSNTLRFSLSWDFDKIEKKVSETPASSGK